jgi:predicted ATPase
LTNWKNFKSTDVRLGTRVFVIGPNASGKSNLLDVFRFLRDVAAESLRAAVKHRSGVSSIRCLSAARNNRVTIDVELLDDDNLTWRYQLEFLQDNNQRPVIAKEAVWRGSEQIISRPDADDERDPERLTETALERPSTNQTFRGISSFLKTVTYLHLIPQAVRDPVGFSPGPVQDDPFGRDILVRIWNTNRRAQGARLKKIGDALKAALPQLQSLDVELDEAGKPHLVAVYANWRAQGAKQRENQFSDGTIRLLGLLWATFEGTGPLLIEEPELSLHPEIIRRLPSMFVRINRMRKESARQTLISTHSPDLLSDSGIPAEEVLVLKPSDQGTVIEIASESDKAAMRSGLTAADVMLPRSAPANVDQLTLAF